MPGAIFDSTAEREPSQSEGEASAFHVLDTKAAIGERPAHLPPIDVAPPSIRLLASFPEESPLDLFRIILAGALTRS
jgi:hypothetical protein